MNIKMLRIYTVVIFFALLYMSTFVVHQSESALRLRLGEIIHIDDDPGLHFMLPFIHTVLKFDRRIQTLDSTPERFLTKEQKDVIVDFYTKWRIANVAQYYRSTGGDIATTERLLGERINTSLRDEFGKRTIQEVISGEREQIMELLNKEMNLKAGEFGVEIVDIRIKRIDLPSEVSDSVYERMKADREKVAKDLRALGTEAAEGIRADADKERTIILAQAYKKAEELRGEGDSKAANIYAEAYQKNPEFYGFYRSIKAYKTVFQDGRATMVLQPDSEFFRFFKNYQDQK
ncbi:membane protease HflC [Achromatium sp. WMS2]|nr:membane protease HflC [Achromatium sp. WMS2]